MNYLTCFTQCLVHSKLSIKSTVCEGRVWDLAPPFRPSVVPLPPLPCSLCPGPTPELELLALLAARTDEPGVALPFVPTATGILVPGEQCHSVAWFLQGSHARHKQTQTNASWLHHSLGRGNNSQTVTGLRFDASLLLPWLGCQGGTCRNR